MLNYLLHDEVWPLWCVSSVVVLQVREKHSGCSLCGPGICADGFVNSIGLPDLCSSALSREIRADVPECENMAEEECP